MAFAAMLCACDKTPEYKETATEFAATLETPVSQTKTQLDGTQVVWSAGDSIAVFKVSSMSDAGYAPIVFGVMNEDDGKANGRFPADAYPDYLTTACYALYPASMAGEHDGNSIKVNLPGVQYYKDGSFDNNANPAVARNDGDATLEFKNLCGLLAIYVKSDAEFSEIKLTTHADEALWGEAKVDMTYGSVPELSFSGAVTPEQKTLTLRNRIETTSGSGSEWLSDGGSIEVKDGVLTGDPVNGVPYYFVVPAGTLSEGFTVTLVRKDNSFMQKDAQAGKNTIQRSFCTVMPDVAFEDESDVVIRTDVKNKAFYKDLFMDAGLHLSQYSNMPIVSYLNLQYEYYMESSESDASLARQRAIFSGSSVDLNGHLLYPDGEPRFKMIYVNGGDSSPHGKSLELEGQEAIRAYVRNGGSYVGSCAGAYLSTIGAYNYDGDYSVNYFRLWPGMVFRVELTGIYPGYIIPDDSPLLKYYDFGGDHYVDSVKHWNGPFFDNVDMVPGTEVLAKFDFPEYIFHQKPSIIAYKVSDFTGRVIPCGGHPEQVADGERRDLMAAMALYAMDGVGNAKVKGILRNGVVRRMTKSTTDNDPAYTKIGDKQCHHFAFAVPQGARNIKVRLEALDNFNLSLRLAQGTFAFKEDAQYKVENTDKVKELSFDTLPKGTWYVGVQCEDTVTSTVVSTGLKYTNTAVLNGVPYTVSVSWDI